MLKFLEKDIKPSDIMTPKAFSKKTMHLRLIMILGGSTNAVLHFIAIAKSIGYDLTLDDFQKSVMKPHFWLILNQVGNI